MRFVLITIFLIFIVSCKKEPVQEVATSLIGEWTHYSSEEDWHILFINEDGNGRMEWFTNGKLYKDTKERPWLIKDNTLYFGKVSFNGELYDVESYPQESSGTEIMNFDTLNLGNRYIILDGDYYIE